MGQPSFQKLGSRFTGTGCAWGTSAWGTTGWGGSAYEPFVLPASHIPSDYLDHSYKWHVAEVVHERNGYRIGSRVLKEWRSWNIVFVGIDSTVVGAFRDFFLERRFYLLPEGEDSDVRILVEWVEQDFEPESLRNGLFSFGFGIIEIV